MFYVKLREIVLNPEFPKKIKMHEILRNSVKFPHTPTQPTFTPSLSPMCLRILREAVPELGIFFDRSLTGCQEIHRDSKASRKLPKGITKATGAKIVRDNTKLRTEVRAMQ